MLKLSEQEHKITRINMLRALIDKVDNMQKGQVSRNMETLRENQKGMLEEKNTVLEMKNYFDGLVRRLYTIQGKSLSLKIQ